jgi:hypothetical protein
VLVLVTTSSLFRQLVVPRGQNSGLGVVAERIVRTVFAKGIARSQCPRERPCRSSLTRIRLSPNRWALS